MTPLRQYLTAGDQQLQINTHDLASGIYLLSVNGEYTKFIKRK